MTPGQNTFTLSMTLTGTNTLRYWDIRISQIPCGANYAGEFILLIIIEIELIISIVYILAPNGCLQYFMESTGTVTSFNYLYSTTPAVQHLAYQDYTVCVRSNTVYITYIINKYLNNLKTVFIGLLWNWLVRVHQHRFVMIFYSCNN